MKFLCDENIERSLVLYLREANFDVSHVSEQIRGITDEQVLQQAEQENRILITADLDFGTLIYKHAMKHSGVIVLRLAQLSLKDKEMVIGQLLREHKDKLAGAFTVASINSIRIR